MDCVYHAWVSHSQWLGIEPLAWTHSLFRLMYKLGQNSSGMYGGCVPLTIQILNLASNLRTVAVQHHPFFDRAAFVAGAETDRQRWMSQLSDFGEDTIAIEPAIYLMLGSHHAEFLRTKPEKLAVLAIQIERRE